MAFLFEHVQNFVRCCIEPHIVAVKRHIDSLHIKCFGDIKNKTLKSDIIPWDTSPLNTVFKGCIICYTGEVNSDGNPVVNGIPNTNWHICNGEANTSNLASLFNTEMNFVYLQRL